MKNKIFVCVAIIFLAQMPAMANDISPNAIDEINQNCSAGSERDQFLCVKKLQVQKDATLENAIKKLKSEAKSMWGPLADKEINERVDASQSDWLKYRNEQCEYGLYTKSKAQAPSQIFSIVSCKYQKTADRIKEIESTDPAN
jgi:uncharacterized protein YecT (DUF1311 family)